MSKRKSSSDNPKKTCALCQRPIRKGAKVNQHHPVLKSEGGIEIIEVHEQCHVAHHSVMNHFCEWGRKGGLVTAARGWWIFNSSWEKDSPPIAATLGTLDGKGFSPP